MGVHRAALTVMDQYLCGCPWQLHRLSKASTPVGAQAVAVTVKGQYLCGCPRGCTVMGQYLCGCTRGCIVMGQYLCGCPWQLHKLSEASTSVGVQGAALIVKGQYPSVCQGGCIVKLLEPYGCSRYDFRPFWCHTHGAELTVCWAVGFPTCGAMPYLPTVLQMRAGSLQLCLSQYFGTCNVNNKVS